MIKNIKLFVAYYIIPCMEIEYLFQMFGLDVHRIIVSPMILLMDVIAISLIIDSLFIKKKGSPILFILWLSFNLFTIISYSYNGLPVSCYVSMFRPYIFPMLFFMFGIDKDVDKTIFYKTFLYSALFSFIVGIWLYVTMPSFYLTYLSNLRANNWYGGNSTESYIAETLRMSSFFGSSYAISYLSIPAMCIVLGMTYSNDKKKTRRMYLFAVICWVSALLCQQRIAMAFSFIVVISFYFFSRQKVRGKFRLLGVAFVFATGILIFFGTSDRYSFISNALEARFNEMSISEAYEGSRTSQVETTMKTIDNLIIGDGIGARSTPARRIGRLGVSDVEYVRLLAESGVIGVLLFLLLIIKTMERVLKKPSTYYTEIMIILYFLCAMIGSNSLSISHLYAPIFWYCMGIIWKPQLFTDNNIILKKTAL